MSDIQTYLTLIADALHYNQIGEEGCADLAKALNGVPAEFHAAAFKAFLGGDADRQDRQQLEDLAPVRTLHGSEILVGDEVKVGDCYGVVTFIEADNMLQIVTNDGSMRVCKANNATRTGRIFVSIPAILSKLWK